MVAYVSRIVYPDPAANSIQTIQMAAALADFNEDTCLFVHDLSAPEAEIRREYGIDHSRLKIWSLHTRRWPGLVYNQATLRFMTYNSSVAAILSFHPAWRSVAAESKVLFVRSRLETQYWGLVRPYLPFLRDWLWVCELHDLIGGDADTTSETSQTIAARRAQRMARALESFDLVITVNQALADDLTQQTQGRVQAQVTPLCSGLPRLPQPPVISHSQDRVIIGYFGTVDLAHGIDTAVQALEYLPERFVLRLTGRIREDARPWVEVGAQTGRVECVGAVPYAQMAEEVDRCHLALVPAGNTVHATRYRSPLKIFDAMLRGKAILAADVPCHRELLSEGENAVFFRSGDPKDLANRILALADHPLEIERIATTAWEDSGAYTYPSRAQTLLTQMKEARYRKQNGKASRQ